MAIKMRSIDMEMRNEERFASCLAQECGNLQLLQMQLATEKYGTNSTGVNHSILGAIFPLTHEDVVKIVAIANRYQIPLYPVSTGHNWGYGSATPAADDCWVLDLSQMSKIIYFDSKNGIVTVEPGVTLQQLWQFLDTQSHQWIVPVTGAGLLGSLVGNSLERGFGIPPISNHASAIMGVKAVLGNGETYESLHRTLTPNRRLDRLYSSGLGVNIDSLFTQSNFGIVTEMSIRLRKQPEEVSLCTIRLRESNLTKAVDFIRHLNLTFPEQFGYIQLHNKERMRSMRANLKESTLSDWHMLIIIYGNKSISKFIARHIKQESRRFAQKAVVLHESSWRRLEKIKILKFLEKFIGISIANLNNLFAFSRGKPSSAFLEAMLFPNKAISEFYKNIDIEDFQKGVIWFAPLIPNNSEDLNAFFSLVEPILKKFNRPVSISLTSFQGYCFDATIPIFFNKVNEEQSEAMRCFNELLKICINHEFIPYRLGIQSMETLMGPGTAHYNCVEKIKASLDPNAIISPNRYHFSKTR